MLSANEEQVRTGSEGGPVHSSNKEVLTMEDDRVKNISLTKPSLRNVFWAEGPVV